MSKCKLSNYLNSRNGGVETRMIVTVNYDTETYQVDILSIEVQDQKYWENGKTVHYSPFQTHIDITDLIMDNCPNIIHDVICMNWELIYSQSKQQEECDEPSYC